MASAANDNGAKSTEQVKREIQEARERSRERMAIVREAAARWQRLADSLRR